MRVELTSQEDFRTFAVRRPWLHGENALLSKVDYVSLRERDGKFWSNLTPREIDFLSGFMAGWTSAKS